MKVKNKVQRKKKAKFSSLIAGCECAFQKSAPGKEKSKIKSHPPSADTNVSQKQSTRKKVGLVSKLIGS
jgi:hypothetical protein